MDMDDVIDVEISDTQAQLRVDRAWLIGLVRSTLRGEGVERASISIALVDDPTIHELNRRYLAHDWPTDVISFGLSGPDDDELAGELIVSAEMAARTARGSGVEPVSELALYLIHGLLHLCGFDDRTAEQAAAIRRREADHLARLGLSNTFAAVGGSTAADAGREGAGCRA